MDEYNHDTIGKERDLVMDDEGFYYVSLVSTGMIVIDAKGRIACGTSTNGATHKIPG